jgi:hypothetical protein
MTDSSVAAIVWVVAIVAVVLLFRRSRRGGRPGPGTTGTVYDLLNEDKRKAIEIIVEERAEARDPEDKDGNLPDLEHPVPGARK